MGENYSWRGETETGEVSLYHEWDRDNSVTETILEGVAAVTNTPLTDLDPPLYEVVDPDALEALCRPVGSDRIRDGAGRLTFPAYGCTVTLYWDGTVKIDPPDQS